MTCLAIIFSFYRGDNGQYTENEIKAIIPVKNKKNNGQYKFLVDTYIRILILFNSIQ